MKNFEYLTSQFLQETIILRNGEIKLGEKCKFAKNENINEILINPKIKFVIFGISEDIGVQANFGKNGTKDMFKSFLKSFLNIQYNAFNNFNQLAILGHFQYEHFQEEALNLDVKSPKDRLRLFEMVNQIDHDVSKLCFQLIKHKKTPIIIGGGHNNCYGIIKGLSLGLGKPINVINIDTHSDFRILEGRHSGNGFSYAKNDSYLNKYYVLGLHENYTSKDVLSKLKNSSTIKTTTYEDIFIKTNKTIKQVIDEINTFFDNKHYGLEIDLDSIPNIMASALTPDGIELREIRKILYQLQITNKQLYLHVCEGIPNNIYSGHTEKTISYLVSDFIKNFKLSHLE